MDAIVKQHPELASHISEETKSRKDLESSWKKKFLHEGGVLAPDVPQNLTILPSINWATTKKREIFPGKEISEPMTIYLLGKITYYDVFTGTPQRSTKFCLMRAQGTSFGICPEGNWME